MKCLIQYNSNLDEALACCFNKFPFEIKDKLLAFLNERCYRHVNEIRLHKDNFIMLIADSKNVETDVYLTESDLKLIFDSLCDNSLYAHFNTIKDGYLSIGNGIRAGVCGRACLDNKEICGIDDISSINIRIPHIVKDASYILYNLLEKHNFKCSVIIYSSPGVGKTTILRDLINKISKTAIRATPT